MLNRKHTFLALSLLLIMLLALIGSNVSAVAAAEPVEPVVTQEEALPPAQEGEAEAMRVLFEETTFVQLLREDEYYVATVCAGNGLNNIQPSPEGPKVLIPNAGDLSLSGSNVAVKLSPDGQITFIPRVQGQMIRVPINVGDKLAGQEVLSLSLDEGRQLMAAGLLVWTARDQGPYGTGHGLNGHIAACDPQYDDEQFKDWADID